jgi:hypothetical protein
MALARYVVTARVSLTADTLATLTAGEPGTGGAAGFGSAATVAPGTSGKYGLLPAVLLPGMVIYADSSAGTTGPQLLYQAIGSSNLRAYADQDAVGHAAISNLLLSERPLLIGDRSPGASRSRRRQARGPPARLAGLQGCELARRGGTAR